MPRQSILPLLVLLFGVVGGRGEEPKDARADGRVIEGSVVADGRKPVEGARVLFCQADAGFAFVEGANATTDAQGRYRAELKGFPWSADALRAVVLASGFEVAEHIVAAGGDGATVDFELKARPWKETTIRLRDVSSRPVAGVDVVCSIGQVAWKTLRTDADGSCRLAAAPEIWIRLSARPEGARPIQASISITDQGSDTITLPVFPPYRGRVLDAEGRPASGVKVGNGWVAIGADGEKRMGPFYRDPVVTDREGRFSFTLPIEIHEQVGGLKPPPAEPVLFAGADFRQFAFRLLAPARSKNEIEVKLQPTRLVRVPVEPGATKPPSGATLGVEIQIIPRPDRPDQQFYFAMDDQDWRGKPTGEAAGHVMEAELPEGTYRLTTTLWDGDRNSRLAEAGRDLVVPAGAGPLDLPPLVLGPTRRRQAVGRPAPEIDATELDTGRRVRLADFRGRVIVLDFWGYWCGSCIWGMRDLVKLQRTFADRPLTILAMHDQSVRSRAEYDRMTAAIRRRAWEGRDLPFSVLIDRPDPDKVDDGYPEGDGATIARYGIQSFPTLVVIDAKGTLVDSEGLWDHDRLEARVRELLEDAEAR